MKPVVAIIAQGRMGSGVGALLARNGIEIRTSLAGRGPESTERARVAGMVPVDDEQIISCQYLLSIVPPGEALALARRFAPMIARSGAKPVYVDCNAVSPATMTEIAVVLEQVGCSCVDAGIIGPPPTIEGGNPTFYASGAEAGLFARLVDYGLDVRVLARPIGAASALKMSFSGITKGLVALGSAMFLAADRSGLSEALRLEMAETYPDLLSWLKRNTEKMPQNAYRFVAEMEEVAKFLAEDARGSLIHKGTAQFYRAISADYASTKVNARTLKTIFSS